ncbi:MAG: nitroreductase family protein [Deltaproteobacteria bacterium]|nr:nitroreductase family protein [Deltaproteobacteria bacterium]
MRHVLEVITTRRTIRRFRDDPVSETVVQSLLKAAIHAPNAGNSQPWHFLVVRNPDVRRKLAEAALGQAFLATAPVVIVVCADLGRAMTAYGERGVSLYCLQDTAAATMNMLLAAHALGFGSSWVGAFDERMVSKVLSLPEFRRPVALVAIGKPAEGPGKPERLPIDKVSKVIE